MLPCFVMAFCSSTQFCEHALCLPLLRVGTLLQRALVAVLVLFDSIALLSCLILLHGGTRVLRLHASCGLVALNEQHVAVKERFMQCQNILLGVMYSCFPLAV